MSSHNATMEGIMRKKGSRMTTRWGERFFVLKGRTLKYYTSKSDAVSEPPKHTSASSASTS